MMYCLGILLEKNEAEGMKWFKKAAVQGMAQAQYNLGKHYSDGGCGVSKNLSDGLEWYKKAAKNGYVKAAWTLGETYYYGKEVPRDHSKAWKGTK